MKYLFVIIILLIYPITIFCSRYDYLLFENYEITKKSFVMEQDVVRNLTTARENLNTQISNLKPRINNILKTGNGMIPIFKRRKNHALDCHFCTSINHFCHNEIVIHLNEAYIRYQSFKLSSDEIYSYEKVYPDSVLDLMIAASKGVIMLQETYNQNIKEFSKGHLRIKTGFDDSSRKTDSLQLADLVVMSNLAFNYYNWYDTGMRYLKEAIDMLNSVKRLNKQPSSQLERTLSKMKTVYPLYHNDMLDKKDNFIGPDWKMYPHKVDIG